MKRSLLLLPLVVGMFGGTSAAAETSPSAKPNVIYIVADDK